MYKWNWILKGPEWWPLFEITVLLRKSKHKICKCQSFLIHRQGVSMGFLSMPSSFQYCWSSLWNSNHQRIRSGLEPAVLKGGLATRRLCPYSAPVQSASCCSLLINLHNWTLELAAVPSYVDTSHGGLLASRFLPIPQNVRFNRRFIFSASCYNLWCTSWTKLNTICQGTSSLLDICFGPIPQPPRSRWGWWKGRAEWRTLPRV